MTIRVERIGRERRPEPLLPRMRSLVSVRFAEEEAQ